METPHNLEIEVKFFVADEEDACRRLSALGATALPRVFESNRRYENSRHSLKAEGKLLRLRRDSACRLTYKCPPVKEDPECKVFQELEVQVDDFETMAAILEAMGYCQVQVYEKWRRTFTWRDVELCLDAMPFGTFLEIEGPKESIKAAAAELGYAWEDRILSNYLSIFDMLRQKFGLPFHDVTFAHFERHPVDIVSVLPALQEGGSTESR